MVPGSSNEAKDRSFGYTGVEMKNGNDPVNAGPSIHTLAEVERRQAAKKDGLGCESTCGVKQQTVVSVRETITD